MKNLFLTKTRWLVTIILLTALGIGNAWGETVTYKQTSTSAASVNSGTAPAGSSVSFNNTYTTKEQLTAGKQMELTLTSLGGISISNITLSMKSNKSSGAGKLSYSTDGGKTWTYLVGSSSQGTIFSDAAWNSSYSTSYVNVSKNVSLSNVTQLKIRIEATVKSLYCQSFTITYTASVTSHTLSSVVSPAESGSVELSATSVAEGSKATATATPAAHYVFDHWSISGAGSSLSSTTTNPTTVTMGTADATVTATFVAAPKASITLSEAGSTTTAATTYYVGDSYTFPSSTGASCGTKVLVGWSTVKVTETDTKPANNFYEKGETVTLEASQTFYAVFANASGGGGGAPTAYTAGDEGTYVLAISVSGTWYALPANPKVTNGKIGGVAITVNNTGGVDYVTSANASGFEWTIANATNGQTISDGSKYIYHSNGGSSGTDLAYSNGTTYTWTIASEQKGLTFKGTNGKTVGSRGLLASGTTFGGYSLSNEDATGYYRIHVLPIGGGTTYSAYSTTCQACVAPTSVTITGTNKYLGGQTISLTAAPDGGTGTPSYQWQKKISGVWKNLENGNGISGATDAILQISSCTHANSGGYRCIVSTGDGCETKSHADDTNGYGVHVYSIHGKYTSDANYADAEIIWTSETTGTATIHLNAKKTYLFKVWSNNGYYYGHGAKANEDFMFQPTTWDCGTDNREMRLFTTVEGDYTFTVNIEHGLDGSPYVNLQVGYPSMTHPNTGYVYVQKFSWTPRLHYWYNDANKLTEWNDDPSLASDQYVNICGTDYWCVPVIDYYCNFIAADHNGQTTGDQHTNSPHPGQRLYNDGSWKWGEFSTYTITYAGGDGSTGGPMASHTGLCPGSSQQLTANAFSKSGYNFSGWTANVDVKIGGSTVPAGTLITGTPIIENVQSNITLTAQWRDLAQYHVTFSADNGTVAGGASQTVTEGGTLTFPNVTSTTCGTFSGWVEAAYDNTAAPSGATYHAVGDELAADPSMDGKTYYAVYHVAMGAPTTTTDVLVYSDFNATGSSYVATNNLRKSSAAVYEAVTAKQYSEAFNFNKISDARGIVTPTSGGVFKSITLTTNTNHSATRKVYVYGSSSYTAAYADPAAFKDNSSVRGTLLATLEGATKTYSTSTDDYEYIAIFADGAAYMDQIDITWYGAPMKYQTSPACSPVINMTSSFSSFTYVYGSGPSASQSFTVSGANLGANLVVTAPANYEVCKTFGGDYTTSVSYTPSDGTVTDQTVYIRLKAGLNVGAYNYAAASGVSAASTGATTRTAALTGSVTKAAGAIAFTDFNAGDHYEAEWTGSAILVPYNYILTGDGTLTTTKVDGRGGTVDTENKKWSLTNEGTYQLRLTLGNGTNYTGAGPVTADFVIYKADRFYDNLHGNDVIVKRNDTGEDHYTIPSLTDESRQTSGSCSETHYHFMGWVPESALSTLSNDAAYDAVMITGGGTQAASGTNYYAVWAEE